MQFQAPALLAWSLLAVAALALYLFRRRPKQLRVSTLPFFKSLARVYQESAWLRRLKRLLSFLLSAAVLLGGTDLVLAFDGGDHGFDVIDCARIHIDALARVAAAQEVS